VKDQQKFFEIYFAAHNNAQELLSDAEILFERGRYATAYFLAFTALEEIAKSQLAADAFTGFIEEKDFWDVYRSHKRKIAGMLWASGDARRYLDVETEDHMPVHEPEIKSRMSALYVECDGVAVESPGELITAEMAKSIIHTVRVAFHRIFEVIEYWGHQIGTKGFMK
jgi:AbiV family abortive infection protein